MDPKLSTINLILTFHETIDVRVVEAFYEVVRSIGSTSEHFPASIIQQFHSLSQTNERAAIILSILYGNGSYVTKNLSLATQYIKKYLENRYALFILACVEHNNGNIEKAREHSISSAQKGLPEAQYTAHLLTRDNKEKSMEYLIDACKAENMNALYKFYLITRDQAYLQRALNAGSPCAVYELGNQAKTRESSKKYYKQAIQKGCIQARYAYGLLLLADNNPKAVKYIETYSNIASNTKYLLEIGVLYYTNPILKDFNRAEHILKYTCMKARNMEPLYKFAKSLAPEELERKKRILKYAANHRHLKSARAYIKISTSPLPVNVTQAQKIIEGELQYSIGKTYLDGKYGLVSDISHALLCFEKSAQCGNFKAHKELGDIYHNFYQDHKRAQYHYSQCSNYFPEIVYKLSNMQISLTALPRSNN